ncbi:MAG TPA: M17 family peptidase N-terminal domain-containing protein [Cellulomonas sp.]
MNAPSTPPLPVPADVRALVPSWFAPVTVRVGDPAGVDALGVGVGADGDLPADLGADRVALSRAGFAPQVGAALAVPRAAGPAVVALGLGESGQLTAAEVRDAAAAFARAVPRDGRLAVLVPSGPRVTVEQAAAAVVEGVLLARHRFDLRSVPRADDPAAVVELVLVAPAEQQAAVADGLTRGLTSARAGLLSRDLAAAPASMATAEGIARVAEELGAEVGLEVEVLDKVALVALGCGGLLGVNRGSSREPRLVRLRYTPAGTPTGHLGLVGKGITYDAGGISLKPSDESHSQMKNDMTGAGAILAALLALPATGATAQVTAWLSLTDNMPSGSAMQLGDVLTMRGGTTVEVVNTDAEGRLVMADALVLAVEAEVDALVDVATLTGATLRTLGTEVAGVLGNDPALLALVTAAGAAADEPVWELPLIRSYRGQLSSPIADLKNLGGPNAGAITAALFLEHFVAGTPWAHLDIAGTAQAPADSAWVSAGPTGFGARLVLELATTFRG